MNARKAFMLHKSGAGQRGIEFHFAFEEWVAWWEASLGPGWLALRGKKLGQYVMARNNDIGPYAPWNVKCITHSQNSREQPKNGKLTEEQVIFIYRKLRARQMTKKQLAKQFDVSHHTVREITRKRTWRSVTDPLDQ